MDKASNCPIMEIPSYISHLAEAASTQIKVSNRYWVLLLVFSLVVTIAPSNMPVVELPFDLPDVEASLFSIIGVLMLSVLALAFCSAHAQVLRVQALCHRIMDEMKPEALGHTGREFFDALRLPAVTRVAPLAQLARGPHQTFADKPNCPMWLKRTAGIYYVCLKILSIVVYFGIPAFALGVAAWHYLDQHEPRWTVGGLVWPLVAASFIALAQVSWTEVRQVGKAWRAIVS